MKFSILPKQTLDLLSSIISVLDQPPDGGTVFLLGKGKSVYAMISSGLSVIRIKLEANCYLDGSASIDIQSFLSILKGRSKDISIVIQGNSLKFKSGTYSGTLPVTNLALPAISVQKPDVDMPADLLTHIADGISTINKGLVDSGMLGIVVGNGRITVTAQSHFQGSLYGIKLKCKVPTIVTNVATSYFTLLEKLSNSYSDTKIGAVLDEKRMYITGTSGKAVVFHAVFPTLQLDPSCDPNNCTKLYNTVTKNAADSEFLVDVNDVSALLDNLAYIQKKDDSPIKLTTDANYLTIECNGTAGVLSDKVKAEYVNSTPLTAHANFPRFKANIKSFNCSEVKIRIYNSTPRVYTIEGIYGDDTKKYIIISSLIS